MLYCKDIIISLSLKFLIINNAGGAMSEAGIDPVAIKGIRLTQSQVQVPHGCIFVAVEAG